MVKKGKSKKIDTKTEGKTNNLEGKIDTILGIKINSASTSSVLKFIENKIAKRVKIFIVTPNPEIVVQAQSDLLLASILNSAELSLPDGVGLVWASKWKELFVRNPLARKLNPLAQAPRAGSQITSRVSGIDVMEAAIKKAAERGWRVFLLGGRPGVAEKAAENLRVQYPNIMVSNYDGPWLDSDGKPQNKKEEKKEREAISKINAFKPYLLFVAYGAPKQEKWVRSNYDKIETLVTMVIGGSLDYISGNVNRAPFWARRIGIEWLFRLAQEPWRLGRQLALIKFIWLVAKQG